MPLQNRVTPFGELIAVSAKGAFMGNRGILHDQQGELTRKRWSHKSWVTCALNFKDYKRTPKVRTSGNYTELFFLDEATALAAGHRPCGQCRYHDFTRFVECWTRGNGREAGTSIKEIDAQLHADRTTRDRQKVTYTAPISSLPEGVFVQLDDTTATAWLLWDGHLLEWRPEGYGERRKVPAGATVTVLTPRATVNAIAAGYRPSVRL